MTGGLFLVRLQALTRAMKRQSRARGCAEPFQGGSQIPPVVEGPEDLSVPRCLPIRLLLKEEMLSPRSMNPRNGEQNCVYAHELFSWGRNAWAFVPLSK